MLEWLEYGKLLAALWALVHPVGAVPPLPEPDGEVPCRVPSYRRGLTAAQRLSAAILERVALATPPCEDDYAALTAWFLP